MDIRTPAIIQDENMHTLRGKCIEGVKADLLKPVKKERKARKALADLSKLANPVVSAAAKGSVLKARSSLHNETTKRPPNRSILTDEEIKKCHEWAKEGIELAFRTDNDLQKHHNDVIEKWVKNQVDLVDTSMREWNRVLYDCVMPVVNATDDIEDFKMLELEPELLLPKTRLTPTSGVDGECTFLEEPEIAWPFDEHRKFELKLKKIVNEGDAPF